MQSVAADVFTWLESPARVADVMVANLFLHHFQEEQLAALLQRIAARTSLFLAREPRRSSFALLGARCLSLMGCNAVTRHDAVVSVRAGAPTASLGALAGDGQEWELREQPAGLFSHCFFAQRNV